MTEMFKIFVGNLETIIKKFSIVVYDLQDSSLDMITKLKSEGENTYEEAQRSVSIPYFFLDKNHGYSNKLPRH